MMAGDETLRLSSNGSSSRVRDQGERRWLPAAALAELRLCVHILSVRPREQAGYERIHDSDCEIEGTVF
jgi:hypothetical protein